MGTVELVRLVGTASEASGNWERGEWELGASEASGNCERGYWELGASEASGNWKQG